MRSPADYVRTGGDLADLVSIVIPCFDAERWLAGAIESALAQSWPDVEVIVVDDGSTDRSVAIARSYERVQVLTGPNAGPGAARNRGIAAARGRWVQLLDADDVLLPRKVEACLRRASQPDEIPFAGAIPFGGPHESGLARWLRGAPAPFRPDEPLVTALTYEIQTSQPLYPMDRLRAVGGFRAELRWLEDIDLNLRLVLGGARYVPVGEPLVLLRDHREPGRQRLHPGAALGRLRGEEQMFATVRDAGALDAAVRRVFADRLAYAARQAWLAGEKDAAGRAWTQALALAARPRPTRVPLYNHLARHLGLAGAERLRTLGR